MNGPTPGPWRVEGRVGRFEFDIIGPFDDVIGYADYTDTADLPTRAQAEANAYLFAAAPDLLASLRELVQVARSLSEPSKLIGNIVHDADRAIARAEGRS